MYPKAGRLTESTGAPLSLGLDMLTVEGPCLVYPYRVDAVTSHCSEVPRTAFGK
jgi:hypothetical protein